MTPTASPTPGPHRHDARSLRWRHAWLAVMVSAVLVVSPLTNYAMADDQLPASDPSATETASDAPADESTPSGSADPSGAATATPDQPADGPTGQSTNETTNEPTKEPATEPTKQPTVKPGQDIAGGTDLAALQCNTVYSIQGTDPRNIWSVNTGTGVQSSVGSFTIAGASQNLNGLGISADGEKVFGILPANSGTGRSVYLHTRSSGATSLLGAGMASAAVTHGAVNPANGFYYYGGLTGSTLNVYGFNTTTNSSIGLVASGTITNGGANGDWAFDAQGSLYVVAGNSGNNPISVINQAIPTTTQATPVAITGTLLATSTAPAAINGIAFGGNGFLYIASGAIIYQINPTSGATVSQANLSQTGSVDLASCAVPSTVEVRKNLPGGRFTATDQATLSISGGGLAAAVTATTAGTDTGIQSDPTETAGPVLAVNGTTYTVSESGAGTAAAAYTSSWACVNTTSGTTLASGTGTSGTVTVPAGTATATVLCTFTNVLKPQDFGDAPASFGTTSATSGPRHLISGYNSVAHTATLMLGSQIDDETDGVPTVGATGDDAAGTDDEDALPNLSLASGATTASATVPLVNTTGAAATLYGWVDANSNGTFQASEAATASVPNGATSATLSWTGLTAAVDGAQPVVRLRLTSATLTDTPGTPALDERSQGTASDGEVEDSLASVATTLPSDCANPFVETFGAGAGRASAATGQTTYTYQAAGTIVAAGNYALVPGITPATEGALWHAGADHTPADTNGRLMLVKGSTAGTYFSKTFTGLQTGSTYDFSAWLANANSIGSAVVPNVTFRIVNPATSAVLGSVSTGNISNKASLVWERYALSFTATQVTVRFEMVNNAAAGTGNDLAIDDVAITPVCEYGDAPDSYGTLRASGGPVHGRGAGLRLGGTIDYEGDGQPGAAANGDDTSGTDDEDGVAAPITVTAGQTTTVQVSATNTTATAATLAGWIDLNNNGTFETGERQTIAVPASSGTANYSLVFPQPSVAGNTYARFRLFPGTVATPLPTGSATAGEVEDYAVTALTTSLSVAKTSDATASSKPGDTVHYTVTLTNTGTGAFTVANPARLVDDLTGVLDDGTYQSDAAATVDGSPVSAPTYAAPRISWSGPLAAGKSVVVRYSVVLKGGGDGHVRNTAFAPPTSTSIPTPDCSAPGPVPCDTELFELPKLTIAKTANRAAMGAAGQTITYTVTVTNTGLGDFTAGHPATFVDNLSAVLDDTLPLAAGGITASRGTATFTSPNLSWSGTLPAGQSATITYTLTYTGAGNHQLDNQACIPLVEAANPADTCRTVSVPGSALRHHKSVNPASGTSVDAGQVLTYTLTFENVGSAAAVVDATDDLSDVLDDAQLVGAPVAGAGLTATVVGTDLEITGNVAAGQTRTVTYQVQVRPWAAQVNHLLVNVLACEPGEPAPCAPEMTTNPVRHLALTKTSNATADSKPGDLVTYTVTATNDGPGDWTAVDPATLVDDLTGVLDDATYDGTTVVSSGSTSYAAPRLTWTGALAHGNTVTITYSVTLKGGGDGNVDNVVWQPGPGAPGPTPNCSTSPLPCAEHGFDLPKLILTKAADKAQVTATGQTVTYTITVTNPGPGSYTNAHPAFFLDGLADVLDDAELVPGSITASTGTTQFASPLLAWGGVLTAGQSATISYTVTYRATGNHVLDNTACVPAVEARTPAERCGSAHVVGSSLTHAKSVSPASGTAVSVGQVLTYTLTFANTGTVPAEVNTHDDLSGVLDDATLVAGSITAGAGLTATPSGSNLNITGTVPAGATRTVTYQVTVKPFAQQGDHVLTNALACEPGDPTPCAPQTTTNPVAHLAIDKSSNRTVDSKPGDTITYTVTATNDGPGDFTAGSPASVVDDLTGVLDDATYGNDAASNRGAAPTYAAPRITWVGALAHGDTVTITYTVVLKGGGDGVVRNTAWQPVDPGNPGPTPDCAVTTRPCDTESFTLPKLTLAKSANRANLPATGQTITYTVVVSNPGPGSYTAAHPATFSDDLSEVMDDATVGAVNATVGSASITGTTLSWTGVLAAGQSATITYTFTYRATGNRVLDNTACIPASEAQVPADACDTVSVPGSGLVHRKSVSPASGTPVEVGDVLTYTLTFDNTLGTTAATVNTSDDLSAVLDDATLVAGSINAGAGLTATPAGNSLNITGTVPAGATRTVTYQVTVKPFAQQGDHVLTNALACEPGEPAPCAPETTTNPVAHLVIDKSSNRTVDSKPGDTITYTVTATNDGLGDFTAADQASVVDDLTGVLDDATYGNDATSDRGAAPTYAAPRITWVGALAHGDTVTITYTVVLKGGGDGVVRNTAWQPVDPGNPGPTPDCAVTTRPCDTVSFDLPKLVITKDASRTELNATGQTVTYTITVTNAGPGNYTAGHPAAFSDNLSDVVDDAEVGPVNASTGTATFVSPLLVWTGALNAGQSATITYTATYRATGNRVLDNTACIPVAEAQVPANACDSAHVVGSSLTHAKSVSPASGTPVEVGDVLTYTLTFTNTGTVPADVNTHDDLSGVLDDATLVGGSITAGAGLTATPAGNSLNITGTVPAGATRTVTYQVTVKPFAQQGDHVLQNALACEAGRPHAVCPGDDDQPGRAPGDRQVLEPDRRQQARRHHHLHRHRHQRRAR